MKKIILLIILPVLLLSILAGCAIAPSSPDPAKQPAQLSSSLSSITQKENNSRESVTVKGVIDGDTVEVFLNGKKEDVRLIGVDTPETKDPNKPVQPYGPEASAFTKKILEGKKVYLESDVQQRDKYGRLLGYLYLQDGTFFNAELIRQGYAKVLTVPPNVKYSATFVQLQQEARRAGRGLWGLEKDASAGEQETTYIGSTSSMKFHRPDCKWGQKITSSNRIVFNSREEAIEQGYTPCKVCGP